MSQTPSSLDVVHKASAENVESGSRMKRRAVSRLPLLLVWMIGFALSLSAHMASEEWADQSQREHFHRLANEEIHEIQTKILSTVSSVRAVRALFYASNTVSRDEFRIFVDSLEVADSVQALAWVPKVPHSLRSEYEQSARKSGISGFEFTERSTKGVMMRSVEQEEYYPVFYLEPYFQNEPALGFDLGSNETRMAALRSARVSGREVASARVILVQGTSEQFGFLVCLPVYRDGSIPDSVEERDSNLLGFSVGTFRIGDLVTSALFEGGGTYSPIEIHVFDKSAEADAQLLYPKNSPISDSVDLLSGLHQEGSLNFASRSWSIIATPTEGSVFTEVSFVPWLVLAFGLLVTSLMAMWIGAVVCRCD